MKSRIICLAPGRVAPGMTLAISVTGHDGQSLLSAGTVLDSEMLERLIRRGVETVSILLLDARDEETIAQDVSAAKSRVNYIFRGNGSPARAIAYANVVNFRNKIVYVHRLMTQGL
jgi:hypothetical protein